MANEELVVVPAVLPIILQAMLTLSSGMLWYWIDLHLSATLVPEVPAQRSGLSILASVTA
ncbi:hypothetical protein F5Y08DRAFT_338662 [Xylaria arbuscula]|nr:hypothetical protein F5Y08DRAFT_338662 [Xylaria arbuscula]